MLSIQPKKVFIHQILPKFFGIGVGEYAKVGIERGREFLLGNKALVIHNHLLPQFSIHSFNRSLPDQSVVREHHIAQEIYALMALEYLHFIWMKTKLKFCFEKVLDFFGKLVKIFSVSGYNKKVVGVSGIVFNPQILFHKLIELIHIRVGEKLRSEITNGKPFLGKEIGIPTRETSNYFFQKPQSIWVLNLLSQDLEKDSVINGVKKLFNVAFQNITRASVISGHFSDYPFCCKDTLVIAFTNSTREGVRDKGGFKNWIENVVDSVVEDPISDGRFVNMSFLRIINIKIGIWSVLVFLREQISLKLKYILLQFFFKLQNVWLTAFTNLKLLPRQKQVLQITYFAK